MDIFISLQTGNKHSFSVATQVYKAVSGVYVCVSLCVYSIRESPSKHRADVELEGGR